MAARQGGFTSPRSVATRQGGFTLIELIVAIGIFAVVSTLIVVLIVNIFHISRKFLVQRNLNYQFTNMLESLSRDTRMAHNVGDNKGIELNEEKTALKLRVAGAYRKEYSIIPASSSSIFLLSFLGYDKEDVSKVDVVLALDVSQSMNYRVKPNEDISADNPTKLDALKINAKTFIDQIKTIDEQSDREVRLSIVKYSDLAENIHELSNDWDSLKDAINSLNAPPGATNICHALEISKGILVDSANNDDETVKIVILMSDGRANQKCPGDQSGTAEEDTIDQANLIWNKGYYLLSIGFGMLNHYPGSTCYPDYRWTRSIGSVLFVDEIMLRKIARDYVYPADEPEPTIPECANDAYCNKYCGLFLNWTESCRCDDNNCTCCSGNTQCNWDSFCLSLPPDDGINIKTANDLFAQKSVIKPYDCMAENLLVERYFYAETASELEDVFEEIAQKLTNEYYTPNLASLKASEQTSQIFDIRYDESNPAFNYNQSYNYVNFNIDIKTIKGLPGYEAIIKEYNTTITNRDYAQYDTF